MGISGLLPLLRSIHKSRHICEWAGKTVGVDAYGWLHKGTISCAVDLALGRPNTKYVDYVMNRVKMLMRFGVIPYLVFDGDYLPSKAGTEAERERKRAQCRTAGLELLKLGRSTQAHLEFQKSIDVTPTMARHVIDACKAVGVKCLVAPYEADSQLYYLEKAGIIDAVVSEDSDLLVFGVKCLLTKLDQYGECVEINRDMFTACKEVSLAGWTHAEFRQMCILSGCDYLDNIPSLGLKTAHRLIKRHREVKKVLLAVELKGKMAVPPGYFEAFKRAELTFQFQRVFCPLQNRMVMANEPGPNDVIDNECLVYIGPEVESPIAIRVACGELDPMTKEPIQVTTPVKTNKSITSFFKPKSDVRSATRTALRDLDMNKTTTTTSLSSPTKGISTPTAVKRAISTTASPKTKKLKRTPSSKINHDGCSKEERSPYFQGSNMNQSRRAIDTPTPKVRTNNQEVRKNLHPTSATTAVLGSSLTSTNTIKTQNLNPAEKNTKGWKDTYGYQKSSPAVPKGAQTLSLSAIIEKSRHVSVGKRTTPLQHLKAQSIAISRKSVPSRTFSAPLLYFGKSITTDSSDSGGSQEDWPEFVGVGAFGSQSDSASTATGDSQENSPGDGFRPGGRFRKFAYGAM